MFVPLLLAAVSSAAPATAPSLPVLRAAPAVSAPAGSRQTEEVSIETRDSQKIQGTFYVPKKRGQLSPGVLLVHDAGGTRSQVQELAERLQKLGFAVLTMDLRGHGASRTVTSSWEAMSQEDRAKTWTFASRDVDAASRWLSRHTQVHATNLSIVGVRAGSSLAVRHSSRDQNIMAVVLVAPETQQFGFDLEDEIEDLQGLPTCILAKKDDAKAAEAISARGNSLGDPYIEVIKTPSKGPDGQLDRKQASEIAKWLKVQAMPKKGR